MNMTVKIPIDHLLVRHTLLNLTNEYEAGSNDVRQQIASEWFIVLAVTFAKEANERVESVLTQTLSGKRKKVTDIAQALGKSLRYVRK